MDPALAAAVLEIERHIAAGPAGTSRPGSTPWSTTAELVAREPALAAAMGLDDAAATGR